MCSSLKSASNDLCHSLALVAQRLYTLFVDPVGLASLLFCHLIALDKNSGVHPIGIGEVARQIIAKVVLYTNGSIQLCSGHTSGCEEAVHAMNQAYNEEDTQVVLLVDASNAFNCHNRNAALLNIRHFCPPLATILINTYRQPTSLFMDGTTLFSQEGTTQGETLAMSMYAIGILPLNHQLNQNIKLVWYADYATATCRECDLKQWWHQLENIGPNYGYVVNPTKTWLIVKETFLSEANEIFKNTNIRITTEGHPHLGAALGTQIYVDSYVGKRVNELQRG